MHTQDPQPKPPVTSIAFTETAVLLETPGTLNTIEVHSASPYARIWALDSATGETGRPLAPSSAPSGKLAAGVRLNFGQPFTSGLSVLVVGTITATAIIQE